LNPEKVEMGLPVGGEKPVFLTGDPMAEMAEQGGRLFLERRKMKIPYWSTSTKRPLKQKVVKTGGPRTNMVQMLMTWF
jgi:hypothetical protein